MPGVITRGIKTNILKGFGNTGTSFPVSRDTERASFGRVTRTVLGQESCTEAEWELFQKSQALYGVFYRKLGTGIDGQIIEESTEKFAYCFHSNIRQIPVKGEIVRLEASIAPDQAAQLGNLFRNKVYWTEIVPAWNHPHLNMLPDLQSVSSDSSTDAGFEDKGNSINPLQLCPGDITIEGRHGESLRLGGAYFTDSPISTKKTNGIPYIILRAGQGAETGGQGDRPVYEDINADSGSLYITTGQAVPLQQAATKRSAWGKETLTEAKDYTKPQIILTSDRLWLNGRDDIELSAKNQTGITANQVNIDGNTRISLDASKIYLGNGSQDEKEPVLKGATTTQMISDLTDQYITLLNTIVEAGNSGNGDPGAFIGALQAIAKTLLPILKTYQNQLPTLHSKKVYTE